MTYRNRNESSAVTSIAQTEPAPSPDEPESPASKDPSTHEVSWSVQKIEGNIGGFARVTLAPDANDDKHRITFDVPKEKAAQYAVGGTHLITIGSRIKFWWEGEEEEP
jgi:hypothetical protein